MFLTLSGGVICPYDTQFDYADCGRPIQCEETDQSSSILPVKTIQDIHSTLTLPLQNVTGCDQIQAVRARKALVTVISFAMVRSKKSVAIPLT